MPQAVDAMKQALISVVDGTAKLPLRTHLDIDRHQGTVLIMPAHVDRSQLEALTIKVVSIFGDNPAVRQLPRIQGVVIVLDPVTGQPQALLQGSMLTGIRTAAASGAATDALARTDCESLAILGAGVQARTHLDAMLAVRPIRKILFWSRRRESVEELIDDWTQQNQSCECRPVATAEQAVAAADIVCTVTSSKNPIFDPSCVQPGTHFNVVGSYQPHVREVPPETVLAARVFVDEIDSALAEACDLIQPLKAGLMTREHILGTVGEVLTNALPGRLSDADVTLFKSVGNAAQDALAAATALTNATERQLGTTLNW